VTSPLAAALSPSGAGMDFRVGTIATTNPLVVNLPTGSLRATSRLSSYTPVVGNVVMVLTNNSGAAVVLGRLVYP
jgi:hypothetical protein